MSTTPCCVHSRGRLPLVLLLVIALSSSALALDWLDPILPGAPERGYSISPHDPSVISVANGLLPEGPVAVSRDGGATFTPVPGDVFPEAWTWDLYNPDLIWGRVDDSLWRSLDNGESWAPVNWPYPGQYPTPLQAPHAGAPLYVFADHGDGWCIHKSNDQGGSWYTMHEDDGNTLKTLRSVRLVRTPGSQTWIYAIAEIRPQPNAEPTHTHIVRSTSAGMNWNLMQPDPEGQVPVFSDDLAVHPTNPNRIYVSGRLEGDPHGTWYPLVSTNGGGLFSKVLGPWGDDEASVHPRRDGSLVAFARDGMYVSDDLGETWESILADNSGWPPLEFPAISPSRILFNGQDLDRLLLPYEGLLLKGTPFTGGTYAWRATVSGLRGNAMRSLSTHYGHATLASHDQVVVNWRNPNVTNLVAAGPGVQARLAPDGRMARWHQIPDAPPNLELRTSEWGWWYTPPWPAGAITMVDFGWMSGLNGGASFLGTLATGELGYWESADPADGWGNIRGIVPGGSRILPVQPSDTRVIVDGNTLYISSDEGATFVAQPQPVGIDGFRSSPSSSQLVRYDLTAGSAEVSSFGPDDWQPLTTLDNRQLQIPPVPGPANEIWYVADNALWHCDMDGEETWVRDIESAGVFDLVVGADTTAAIATWEGLIRSFHPTHAIDRRIVLPSRISLAPVYPNPFNGQATVTVTLPAAGNLSVELINLLGQRVMTVVDAPVSAGSHPFVIDGSRLASGSYLLRAALPGQSAQVQRVVLVK